MLAALARQLSDAPPPLFSDARPDPAS